MSQAEEQPTAAAPAKTPVEKEKAPEPPMEPKKQAQAQAARTEAAPAVEDMMAAAGQRVASPGEAANAQRVVRDARNAISRFHELRRRNNAISAGMRRGSLPPDEVRKIMALHRSEDMERKGVAALRRLIRIILGREPTKQEVQGLLPQGFEESLSMGSWPVVVTTGLVAAGAAVHSIFSYLATQEENIALQIMLPAERLLYRAQQNIWAIAAICAVGAAGYMYWRFVHKPSEKAKTKEPKERPLPEKNPEDSKNVEEVVDDWEEA